MAPGHRDCVTVTLTGFVGAAAVRAPHLHQGSARATLHLGTAEALTHTLVQRAAELCGVPVHGERLPFLTFGDGVWTVATGAEVGGAAGVPQAASDQGLVLSAAGDKLCLTEMWVTLTAVAGAAGVLLEVGEEAVAWVAGRGEALTQGLVTHTDSPQAAGVLGRQEQGHLPKSRAALRAGIRAAQIHRDDGVWGLALVLAAAAEGTVPGLPQGPRHPHAVSAGTLGLWDAECRVVPVQDGALGADAALAQHLAALWVQRP